MRSNKKIRTYIIGLAIALTLANAPLAVFAEEVTAPSQRDQTKNSPILRSFLRGAGYTAPSKDMTCSTNAQGVEVCVPSNDVRAYIVTLIRVVLSVVGFLFFGLLVYAGYLWTTAGGNEEAVKKGRSIATKAIIGFAVILAAYAITTFITTFLQKAVAQ